MATRRRWGFYNGILGVSKKNCEESQCLTMAPPKCTNNKQTNKTCWGLPAKKCRIHGLMITSGGRWHPPRFGRGRGEAGGAPCHLKAVEYLPQEGTCGTGLQVRSIANFFLAKYIYFFILIFQEDPERPWAWLRRPLPHPLPHLAQSEHMNIF